MDKESCGVAADKLGEATHSMDRRLQKNSNELDHSISKFLEMKCLAEAYVQQWTKIGFSLKLKFIVVTGLFHNFIKEFKDKEMLLTMLFRFQIFIIEIFINFV